jgi:hypothetical protein
MPLAIYREMAAHLQQVEGIKTELIPQSSPQFDYLQSQVEGLRIEYGANFQESNQERVKQILDYYASFYS